MLTSLEDHRKVFPDPPLFSFRRCKSLKDILVRVRLSNGEMEGMIVGLVLVVVNLVVKCAKLCVTLLSFILRGPSHEKLQTGLKLISA